MADDTRDRVDKGGGGLRGDDRRQGALRDERHGAHDSAAPPIVTRPMQQKPTPHEAAQHGADVRSETTPTDDSIPLGLKRKPKGPLSPTRGRAKEI